MAIFEVEHSGKAIKTFEADGFIRNGESFQFFDQANSLVGEHHHLAVGHVGDENLGMVDSGSSESLGCRNQRRKVIR